MEIAYHQKLNLNEILIIRSFNQAFEQLNDVSYLTGEMIHYFDPATVRQLKGCVKFVDGKKEKYSLSKMFSCELKFIIYILKTWLCEKFFRRFQEPRSFHQKKNVQFAVLSLN